MFQALALKLLPLDPLVSKNVSAKNQQDPVKRPRNIVGIDGRTDRQRDNHDDFIK